MPAKRATWSCVVAQIQLRKGTGQRRSATDHKRRREAFTKGGPETKKLPAQRGRRILDM